MSTPCVEERIILSMKHRLHKFSPKGLRVLVVDDNPFCLAVIERMLQQCLYHVTKCAHVSQAIYLLKESGGVFDIVMSEVHMPDQGGFKLLEIDDLGLDLPVILMSEKGETNVVMRGIAHGACDYLIKPIRMEELSNIWQHVFRRRHPPQQQCNLNAYMRDDSLRGESSDGGRTVDPPECFSKKRKYKAEAAQESEDTGQMIQDISGLKKARVHWTVQLHHQFVKSVNDLQIDKAVPKKILETMKVQGLTRENVASHLQKYRLYLRRMSGIIPEPCPITTFQAAGEGKDGGSMHIRQGDHNPHEHLCLSSPAALNLSLGGMDKATLISLQQYQTSEQRRAAAHSHYKAGLGIDPGAGLARKPPKKNWPASASQRLNTAVKSEQVVDTAKMAGLCTEKSQSASLSFTGSTCKTTVDAQEEKDAEILSTWNDADNLFVEKFVNDYELPNLSVAAPVQDFMSTLSAADVSDYLIED